jgi:HEXXH motif-containing protein
VNQAETSDRSLGRHWGEGRFSLEECEALRLRLARATAASLLGSLSLLAERGEAASAHAAAAAIDATRRLSPIARSWLLTHATASDAVKCMRELLANAQRSGGRVEAAAWLEERYASLLRGATLVGGGSQVWRSNGPELVPGVGLRLDGRGEAEIRVEREGEGFRVRDEFGLDELVPAEATIEGQLMAVGHRFAQPSFTIGGVRVHVDAEDPAFVERWVPEARFSGVAAGIAPMESLPRWCRALEAAARVAETTLPLSAGLFGRIVRTFVPITSPDPLVGCSLSDRNLPGAIMSTIDGPAVLAENLVHEFRHNLLHQLEQVHPLYLSDSPVQAVFYSPWRDDPRPLHGILHALFVFLDVCAIHAGVRNASLGDQADLQDSAVRLAGNVLRMDLALLEFRRHAKTTEFGSGFVEGIETAMTRFREMAANLPAAAIDEAREQVEAHRRARGAST